MRKLYSASALALLVVGFLLGGNAYDENNCAKIDLKLKNQTDPAFEKIKSLKKCAKPAVKYRLKACVRRKREGSKGFNCLHESAEILKSNGSNNCMVKFGEMKTLFKQLEDLIEGYDICLEKNKTRP